MAKYMIVDGLRAEFTDEKNILQVIRNVGIHIPTFCYYTDLSIYGACRMCVVEDDKGNIIASCSTPPKDKMVIRTNTPKLHHHRKMILELLLASHCRDCTICEKNQKPAPGPGRRFGLYDIRFKNNRPNYEIDDSSPAIVRDMNKCILCGDCVRMCNEIQHVGAIDFVNRGSNMMVSPAFNRKLSETECVNCGQCAAGLSHRRHHHQKVQRKGLERPVRSHQTGHRPGGSSRPGWPSVKSSAWLPVKTFIRSTPPSI